MMDYLNNGNVTGPSLALLALALGLVLIGAISVLAGLILHTIARRFQELDRQWQLFESELYRVRSRE